VLLRDVAQWCSFYWWSWRLNYGVGGVHKKSGVVVQADVALLASSGSNYSSSHPRAQLSLIIIIISSLSSVLTQSVSISTLPSASNHATLLK
jgi:hypothetical protein